jgi:hypothetical protein
MDQLSEAEEQLCPDLYDAYKRKTISQSKYHRLMAVLLEQGTPEQQKRAKGFRKEIPAKRLSKARKYAQRKHLILLYDQIYSNIPAGEGEADEDSEGRIEQQQQQQLGQRTLLKLVVHGGSVLLELVTQAKLLAVQGRLSKAAVAALCDGYVGMPKKWVDQVYDIVSKAVLASLAGEPLSCMLVLASEVSLAALVAKVASAIVRASPVSLQEPLAPSPSHCCCCYFSHALLQQCATTSSWRMT